MAVPLSTTTTKLNLKLFNNNHHFTAQQPSLSPTTLSLFTGSKTEKKGHRKRVSCVNLDVNNRTNVERRQVENYDGSVIRGARKRSKEQQRLLSEGKDEDMNCGRPICPGCGVFMQDEDPNAIGFFKRRELFVARGEEKVEGVEGGFDGFEDDFEDEGEDFGEEVVGLVEGSKSEKGNLGKGEVFALGIDEFEEPLGEEKDEDLDFDGFGPAGVGYGNVTEEVLERERRKREEKVSKAERKRMARDAKKERDEVTVCARCHSLRNYGQVKNQAAENLIPDFDFDRLISTRLVKPTGDGSASVVVMVVDCVDFDGSFPKRAAKSLFKALEAASNEPKASKKLPKLVLVATKVDLLPSQISPARLDKWVRQRAKAAGAPKLSGVYLVSSRKDLGVRNLLSFIKELAGPRGNVWVIGAQNAGKSTLINTFAKKQGTKMSNLTEALVPGTTLGILRIGGILSAKAKMYDTPGLLHPYLMSIILNRDEQKMVEIRKELQPRTFRVKVGQAVHFGGLVQLDLTQASVETIYITVWASPSVSLHLGKIENAEEIWRNHVGVRLQPPIGQERAYNLGKWKEQQIKVTGTSWDVSSIDIAIAGLGWFSLGLKGEATLVLWTFDGIDITVREPLVLDRALFLERPGFWLPEAISNAIGNKNKLEAQKKKKQHVKKSQDSLLEVST